VRPPILTLDCRLAESAEDCIDLAIRESSRIIGISSELTCRCDLLASRHGLGNGGMICHYLEALLLRGPERIEGELVPRYGWFVRHGEDELDLDFVRPHAS
jgi:hypothetical protein